MLSFNIPREEKNRAHNFDYRIPVHAVSYGKGVWFILGGEEKTGFRSV